MIIEELIMKFLQNSWIIFITTTFTIIGIPLSIYLYFKSKKEKSLKFEIKSNNIFKNFESIIENIKVTCEDKNISTLTITKILIWCDGKETIYNTDIATQMPLIIKSKEGKEILEAKIVSSNNQTNNTTLEKLENNNYKINFEFLDNKDGFIIQVVHTGSSSKDIILNGKIKGMKGNIEKKDSKNNKILNKIFESKILKFFILKLSHYFILFTTFTVIVYTTYLLISKNKEFKKELEVMGIGFYVIFIFYIFMFISTAKLLLKKRRIPKEFQDF